MDTSSNVAAAIIATQPPLLQDIRSLIDATRTRVAVRVNAEITDAPLVRKTQFTAALSRI